MSTAQCAWCGRMLWPDIPHQCSATTASQPTYVRLALLESLLAAARAWDKSGRWQDYKTLHEAIVALEDADA